MGGELPELVENNGIAGYKGSDILSLIVPGDFALSYMSRSGDQVNVRQGQVTGTIDKRGIGAEDGRLLDAVVQTHGTEVGADFLNRMTKMTIAMCTSLGFTTGIDDEDLPPDAKAEIAEINKEASEAVDTELSKYGNDGQGTKLGPVEHHRDTEENILQILDSGRRNLATSQRHISVKRTQQS